MTDLNLKYRRIGEYVISAGTCAHKSGFKGNIPTWLHSIILKNNLWHRFHPDNTDQGRRFMGNRHYRNYLFRYIVVDSDDYTDCIAEIYKFRGFNGV
jgi:coenzyme F420-reducing hydrogenase gamma subunit